MNCRTALLTVLDQIDYTTGMCRPNDMVAAALPKEVIKLAREAIAADAAEHGAQAISCWACGGTGIIRCDGIAVNCPECNHPLKQSAGLTLCPQSGAI